jgi:glycosyltransferase involved in cell wall biosynthesis
VRAADHVVHGLGRTDVSFTFMGSGDSLDDLVALRDQLGMEDFVEFTGRVPDDVVAEVLSTADVALCPDPKTPLNDVSTMNKTMEYMAFSVPVVAFDLHETRISAGDAAVYVESNDVAAFARTIANLLDDEARRAAMAEVGRSRVVDTLAWSHQRDNYLRVYGLLAPPPSRAAGEVALRPSQTVA